MRGPIPDRWLNYSCYGRAMIDKFIALKVPLSSRKNAVPPRDRFTPEDVIERLPIGLIIDLTNTKRYYDPCDFTTRGVDHVKVAVPGKMTPQKRIVERFNDIVNGYFNDPSNSGKLIGVHCTHGLNRTGYLVCAYLILELGYHPMDAINMFNAKRGHKMERNNYLESLRSMVPGRNASGSRGNSVHERPREHSMPSRQKYSAPYSGQERAANEPDRTDWRQARPQRQYDVEPRRYNMAPRQQQQSRTSEKYEMASYRYDNHHRNAQYSRALPEHNQERWDPTIRRIVRPREHNFRIPSHRQSTANEKGKHTRFD